MATSSDPTELGASPVDVVSAYHGRTKHRADGFAAGPTSVDWDTQPAASRRYIGAPEIALPLVYELPGGSPGAAALAGQLTAPLRAPAQIVTWDLWVLGAFLHLALGVTGERGIGGERWSVRANPSSGNLHPIEAYVLARGLCFVPDGVYHYDPEAHVLERVAHWSIAPEAHEQGLAVALTSLPARETWKYGERALRYVQLDAGHALGALQLAAEAFGANLREVAEVRGARLAACLGLPQAGGALEEPEVLVAVGHQSLPAIVGARGPAFGSQPSWGGFTPTPVVEPLERQWPVVVQACEASRAPATTLEAQGLGTLPRLRRGTDARLVLKSTRSVGEVLLGRRSARRFDSGHELKQSQLQAVASGMLERTLALRQTFGKDAAVQCILMVQRVAGLASGFYGLSELLHLDGASWASQAGAPVPGLPLQCIAEVDRKVLKRWARESYCRQDVASCSSLGITFLAPLLAAVQQHPHAYRALHRQAGWLGQYLYFLAEAQGLQGTGVGCFLDDEVSCYLPAAQGQYQVLYHFALGCERGRPGVR